MAGNNSPSITSIGPCTDDKKPPLDEKKTRNISIKCKHSKRQKCPPSAYLKTFELVPDTSTTFSLDEQIIVNWTGNDPKPPPYLFLDNGQKISGPPYVVKSDVFNDDALLDQIYPHLYKKLLDPSVSKVDFSVNLLKSIFTFNYRARMSLNGFFWGQFAILVHNPDQFEIKIEFPVPGSLKKKGGVKLDKELAREGVKIKSTGTNKTTTSERETNDESESNTTVERSKNYKNANVQSTTTTTTKTEGGQTTTDVDRYGVATKTADGQTTSLTKKTIDYGAAKPEQEKKIITFSKNGSALEVNAFRIYTLVLNAIKILKKIKKIFDDIPKIGAYWTYDISLLTGSFKLNYGYKECNSNHRAFMAVKGAIEITLFDGSLEFGIGISGYSFKLQAYVSGEVSAKIEGILERTAPFDEELENTTFSKKSAGEFYFKDSTQMSMVATGTAELTVGARFEALYAVKINPKLTCGLEWKSTIDFFSKHNHLAEISSEVKFTGLKGTVEVSFGPSGAIAKESKSEQGFINRNLEDSSVKQKMRDPTMLIDERLIWESKFPDDMEKHAPDHELTDEQIKDSVDEMMRGKYLNSGWFSDIKIVVMEDDPQGLPKQQMNPDDAADMLYSKIMNYHHLDKSKESIEFLLLEIRKKLGKLIMSREYGYFDTKYVYIGQYKDLLDHLPETLKNYIDNGKVFKSKHHQA